MVRYNAMPGFVLDSIQGKGDCKRVAKRSIARRPRNAPVSHGSDRCEERFRRGTRVGVRTRLMRCAVRGEESYKVCRKYRAVAQLG